MSSTSSTTSTGAVATSGSTTYIASTASGLDTTSLIKTAMATKTASADTIDATVTANKNKISAYTKVQSLVNALSTSIDALSSSTNLTSNTTSAFNSTSATITSSDSSVSASSVMTATTTSSATAGSYDLSVTQLAKAMKVSGSSMDDTSALGKTGTFTITSSDGTSATINVTSTMTLSDVATAISNQSATTGVNATLVQVSSGQYKLVLSTADTGQTITAATASGDDVLNTIGVTASDGSFANTVQASQSAIFKLDNTTITSASNTVSNVVTGVTLDLTGVTSGSNTVTLTVAKDTSGVTTAVNNFITAYNNLHDYLVTQQSVGSDGSVSSTAYLFADTTLRTLNSELGSLVTGASAAGGANTSSSAISYLSQLGITMSSSNDLTLSSSSALSSALSSNSNAVANFFQSSYTTSNSHLLLMQNHSTTSLNFTLDITASSSGITGATVNGQSGLFTVSGNTLVGVKGTAYAGLKFAISTTSNQSITVNLKQGLADSLVGLGSQYGDTSTGQLETQISSLTTLDTNLSSKSSSIRSAASTYETSLVNQYAKMETEISAAKIAQQAISEILNGTSSSG